MTAAELIESASPECDVDPVEEVERLQRERAGSVESIARRAALGEQISVQELDAALTAAGTTPGDYRNLVSHHKSRNAMRARMAAKPAAEQAHAELTAQLKAANDQLEADIEAARLKYRAAAGPIQAGLEQARQKITDAATAQRELLDTCGGELRQRQRANQLFRNQLETSGGRRMRDMVDAQCRYQQQLVAAERSLAECSERKKAEWEAEVRRLKFRIENLVRHSDPIGKQSEALQREANEIYREMLES